MPALTSLDSSPQAVFKGNDLEYKETDYYRPQKLHRIVEVVDRSSDTNSQQSIPGQCTPFLEVRAYKGFENEYKNNFRYVMTLGIASSFLIMGIVFYTFDQQTKRQDEKMVRNAAQSNTVIASLFPSTVRDRLFNIPEDDTMKKEDAGGFAAPSVSGSTTAGGSLDTDNVIGTSSPSALNATFCDIIQTFLTTLPIQLISTRRSRSCLRILPVRRRSMFPFVHKVVFVLMCLPS